MAGLAGVLSLPLGPAARFLPGFRGFFCTHLEEPHLGTSEPPPIPPRPMLPTLTCIPRLRPRPNSPAVPQAFLCTCPVPQKSPPLLQAWQSLCLEVTCAAKSAPSC